MIVIANLSRRGGLCPASKSWNWCFTLGSIPKSENM
nr:MAG TPA: hypothetical protein [Caudoviricetes sp.]